jgi:hypothetical protein
MERCRTYQGVHIPGCVGCAWFGHPACTCPSRVAAVAEPADPLERRVAALERKVSALVDLLEAKARP